MRLPPVPPTPPTPPSSFSGGGSNPSVQQMEQLIDSLQELMQQLQQVMSQGNSPTEQEQLQALASKIQQNQAQMQTLVGKLPAGMQSHISQDISNLNGSISNVLNAAMQNNLTGFNMAEAKTQMAIEQLQCDLGGGSR